MPSYVGPSATFVIPISTTTSNAVAIDPSMSLVSLLMPSAFTGTALTFTASIDGTNFFQVTNASDGNAYTVVCAASKFIAIPPANLCAFSWLKIVSGSTEIAARTILGTVRVV